MNWRSPVPESAVDSSGQTWQIRRAWPDRTVRDYVLEVVAAGQAGVRGGVLRAGAFELLPEDDPALPSLRAEARHGELVSYRPHMRAVIRADAGYIKVFLPGGAIVPAERCTQTEILLDPGTFTAPGVLRSSPDVIVFSAVPGRPLGDLGDDTAGLSDEGFDRLWEKWQHAWTAQVHSSAAHAALAALPLHSPEVEVADLQRCCFESAADAGAIRPRDVQLVYVGRVDLVERRIARARRCATPMLPIACGDVWSAGACCKRQRRIGLMHRDREPGPPSSGRTRRAGRGCP